MDTSDISPLALGAALFVELLPFGHEFDPGGAEDALLQAAVANDVDVTELRNYLAATSGDATSRMRDAEWQLRDISATSLAEGGPDLLAGPRGVLTREAQNWLIEHPVHAVRFLNNVLIRERQRSASIARDYIRSTRVRAV